MKPSALQLAKDIVYNNKRYIRAKVSEYLLNNVREAEFGYYEFLTESEIKEFESDPKRCVELKSEVEKFITDNFNFYI